MAGWIAVTGGGVRDTNYMIGDIFINNGDENYNFARWPNATWHRLALSDWGIPPEAKAVLIMGRLAITSGTYDGATELEVSFKKPSEPNTTLIHSRYCLQAQCFKGVSAREVQSTLIIPENGQIDFGWNNKPTGRLNYPTTPSVGINISFKQYYI